jgi:DNA (cytosine-5)-methyltransferase 1
MSTMKYNVVSLFSGAMGLDIGLEQTGRFQVAACVEKEPAFCATIRANKDAGRLSGTLAVFERDIADVSPEEILDATGLKVGEIDVLAGGPPCQSFSTAGKRGTVQDPRGTQLWQYLRFVEALKPKFFLMENVRGLVSAALRHRSIAERPDKGGPQLAPDEEPGSVIRLFAEDLQKIAGDPYHMDCFEVNAVNYGTPQLRERAIFIGNRFNAVVDFPEPTHGSGEGPSAPQRMLFDGESKELLPRRTLRDAIGDLREEHPVIMDFSPRKKRYLAMIPPGCNWRSLPEEVQQESMGNAWHAKGGRSGWWRRLALDLPCPTLVTMPNHAGTSLCHPTETRALTLREYARIQGFPDEWEVCGKTSEQYAQIGNAVPVRLGAVAGEVIAGQLDALSKRKWKPLPHKPESFRIIYVQSHVRTRQWFKDGETFVWSDGKPNDRAVYSLPKTKRKTTRMS